MLYLQSLLPELGITENYAVAGSEELPDWHLYPRAYEKTVNSKKPGHFYEFKKPAQMPSFLFEKRACSRKRGHLAALPVNVDCLDMCC